MPPPGHHPQSFYLFSLVFLINFYFDKSIHLTREETNQKVSCSLCFSHLFLFLLHLCFTITYKSTRQEFWFSFPTISFSSSNDLSNTIPTLFCFTSRLFWNLFFYLTIFLGDLFIIFIYLTWFYWLFPFHTDEIYFYLYICFTFHSL